MLACNHAFRAICLSHPWILRPNFSFRRMHNGTVIPGLVACVFARLAGTLRVCFHLSRATVIGR